MKNKIYFLLAILYFTLTACQAPETPPVQKKSIAFIGTYTQKEGHVDGKGAGVSIYEAGPKASDWILKNSFSDIINPSYICLSPTSPIIYAVSEQGPNVPEPKSVIKVIQYDEKTFEMKELQSVSALGHAPCYISVDRNGHYLFVANYVSGNIIQYQIKPDGTLNPGTSFQHHGNGLHPRQESTHAHYIKQHLHETRNTIYATDLGIDKVYEYEARKTGLYLKDSISTEAGAGPRHLVWHPNGRSMYVINELNGTIDFWDWTTMDKQKKQSIALAPKDDDRFTGAADIHLTKDGRFLYASIRGDFNEMLVFSIDKNTYELKFIQRIDAGGSAPRNFSLSPKDDYLIVALQDVDKIMLFSRDEASGLLGESPEVVNIKTPVCVVIQE